MPLSHELKWSFEHILMAPYANVPVQVKRQSGQDWKAEKCQIFKHV